MSTRNRYLISGLYKISFFSFFLISIDYQKQLQELNEKLNAKPVLSTTDLVRESKIENEKEMSRLKAKIDQLASKEYDVSMYSVDNNFLTEMTGHKREGEKFEENGTRAD